MKDVSGQIARASVQVSVLQVVQLQRAFRCSQLHKMAAQQDLQVARLALTTSRRQAGKWRGRMHAAEHRATALQQLVNQKEQTMQQLQTAAVTQASPRLG